MPNYFEFEVSLKYIKPRIWRRFLLREKATFLNLHDAIQDAFRWQQSHLWACEELGREHRRITGSPELAEDDFGEPFPAARRMKLADFFGSNEGRKKCIYIYDFGDNWEHDVKLRRMVSDPGKFIRRLVAGERSGPPEDCGSDSGYYRLVEFLETGTDPYGDDAEDLAEWIGDWRPDQFVLDEAKADFDT